MTIDCPIRAALARIAPHLEILSPTDREMLRPAVRAVENDVEVIPVPERLIARIRDIAARFLVGGQHGAPFYNDSAMAGEGNNHAG